ncbi:MAG TPA: GNAT family N-acetyltransferase [Steroidobacteraceae bacterium]
MAIRAAVLSDAASIASLHASSWQTAYRGILQQDFLDGPVIANRRQLWERRLCADPPQGQFILVSDQGGEIQGFACAFLDADPEWGTLLDNLHVAPRQKGRGLGGQLMAVVAQTVLRDGLIPRLHLWVYEKNLPARRFYERLGGSATDCVVEPAPDGGHVTAIRYAWRPLGDLAARCGHDGSLG